jgi:DNA-directed RNA polymerase alpha subunit
LLASIVGVAVELEAIATEEECDAILSELPDEVSQAVINLKPLLFD